MNRLSLIPGHVTTRSLRALIITPAAGSPVVGAARKRFPSKPIGRVSVSRVPVRKELADELGKHGLHLFLAKVDDLPSGQPCFLRAQSGTMLRKIEFQTLPAGSQSESLKFVVASCYYRHYRRDGAYRAALRSAYCRDAAFKLLLGDNLYMDVAPGQMFVWGGYEETVQRYVSYFHESGYSDVLSCLPTMTTWDDHEFWNNYPEEQIHLRRTKGEGRKKYVEAGLAALDAFQTVLNPPQAPEMGRSFRLDEPRPVSIFMADLRSERQERKGPHSTMFRAETLAKLIEWTRTLRKPGVLVVGQPLLMERGDWMDYNPPDFAVQYEKIVQAIRDAPHDILLVAGDVHYSRLASFDMAGGRTLYEFVCSPACHIPAIVFGQDRTRPTVPGEVTTEAGQHISLRFREYLFGTSAQHCVGVLNFTRNRDGSVAVDAQFLDMVPGGSRPPSPAESERIKITGGHGRSYVEPRYRECSARNIIHLK